MSFTEKINDKKMNLLLNILIVLNLINGRTHIIKNKINKYSIATEL